MDKCSQCGSKKTDWRLGLHYRADGKVEEILYCCFKVQRSEIISFKEHQTREFLRKNAKDKNESK